MILIIVTMIVILAILVIAKHCDFTRNVFNNTFDVFYLVWLPFDILSIDFVYIYIYIYILMIYMYIYIYIYKFMICRSYQQPDWQPPRHPFGRLDASPLLQGANEWRPQHSYCSFTQYIMCNIDCSMYAYVYIYIYIYIYIERERDVERERERERRELPVGRSQGWENV